jgi:hypothetical protein
MGRGDPARTSDHFRPKIAGALFLLRPLHVLVAPHILLFSNRQRIVEYSRTRYETVTGIPCPRSLSSGVSLFVSLPRLWT